MLVRRVCWMRSSLRRALSWWMEMSLVSMMSVGALAQAGEPAALLADAVDDRAAAGQRVAAARLLEAAHQRLVGRLEEHERVLHAALVQLVEELLEAPKYSPPRTSLTTATRSTLLPSRRNRSTRVGTSSGGRLSTQNQPASSNESIAWDLPAPDRPVMITNCSASVTAPSPPPRGRPRAPAGAPSRPGRRRRSRAGRRS